jgi:hypothetical protein
VTTPVVGPDVDEEEQPERIDETNIRGITIKLMVLDLRFIVCSLTFS